MESDPPPNPGQFSLRVAELNRPLGIGTSGRVAALSSPQHLLGFAAKLAARWASLAVGSLGYKGARRPDAILVGYMGHFDVLLARALFPRTPIILDHLVFAADTAKDRGASGRILGWILRRLDTAALRAATVVLVDTAAHQEMVPKQFKDRAVMVLVGAPKAWFNARPPLLERSGDDVQKPLSVVFFGLFTPLQGASEIAVGLRDAAKQRPLRITMVGSGQDYEECRSILSETSVTWLDWVDSRELPSLVARHDVCLGILGTTDKARRVIPNKVYQGMAAGCCVVTSDTATQRTVLGDSVVWCQPGDGAELARQLVRLADDPSLLSQMRHRAGSLADRSFRPGEVVAPLVKRLL